MKTSGDNSAPVVPPNPVLLLPFEVLEADVKDGRPTLNHFRHEEECDGCKHPGLLGPCPFYSHFFHTVEPEFKKRVISFVSLVGHI